MFNISVNSNEDPQTIVEQSPKEIETSPEPEPPKKHVKLLGGIKKGEKYTFKPRTKRKERSKSVENITPKKIKPILKNANTPKKEKFVLPILSPKVSSQSKIVKAPLANLTNINQSPNHSYQLSRKSSQEKIQSFCQCQCQCRSRQKSQGKHESIRASPEKFRFCPQKNGDVVRQIQDLNNLSTSASFLVRQDQYAKLKAQKQAQRDYLETKQLTTRYKSEKKFSPTKRIFDGSKISKELYDCATLIFTEKEKKGQQMGKESKITFPQCRRIMETMGYLTKFTYGQKFAEEIQQMKYETDLLQQMWLILLEANFSQTESTLGALKKFLFVLECLDTDKISESTQKMFKNFIPFKLNRFESLRKVKFQSPKHSPLNQSPKRSIDRERQIPNKKERPKWVYDASSGVAFKVPSEQQQDNLIKTYIVQSKLSAQTKKKPKKQVQGGKNNKITHSPTMIRNDRGLITLESFDNQVTQPAPKIILDFCLDKQDHQTKQPLLFVDINMGPNVSERIVIHDQDSSYTLARDFCNKYGITDFKKLKQLQVMLQQQIDATLPKIGELPSQEVSSSQIY